MSSYFTLPSFARAKKNQEDLEKTNPQKPILNDEDEKFLEKQITQEKPAEATDDVPATKISDSGEEKDATHAEQKKAGAGSEQVAIPETQPESHDGAADNKESATEPVSPTSPKKSKKSRGFDLPSQEDAEKATQGWDTYMSEQKTGQSGQPQGDKRTWASYIPSIGTGNKKDGPAKQKADGATEETSSEQTADSQTDAEQSERKDDGSSKDQAGQRTWAQYASSYVPSSIPSLPQSWTKSKDKDAKAEPVYNEDGTINEAATKEKQEKEVSVLLDKLDMSSINNRVFAFSGETQKIYARFAQVLRDTMDGAPTAYDDMEKLMRDAGPTLEKQFQSMPPFVQTLVKSLPAKLGTTLGPELMAAASEKPGNDMKAQLNAANSKKAAGSGTTTPTGASGSKAPAKNKRKVPGLKNLVAKEGAIASMLRNVVNFLRVRFPFLASGTNVVMSLAVFILMFSFWYCHKRGKEVRLAKAAELEQAGEEGADEGDDYEEDEDEEDEEEGEDDGEKEAETTDPPESEIPTDEPASTKEASSETKEKTSA